MDDELGKALTDVAAFDGHGRFGAWWTREAFYSKPGSDELSAQRAAIDALTARLRPLEERIGGRAN